MTAASNFALGFTLGSGTHQKNVVQTETDVYKCPVKNRHRCLRIAMKPFRSASRSSIQLVTFAVTRLSHSFERSKYRCTKSKSKRLLLFNDVILNSIESPIVYNSYEDNNVSMLMAEMALLVRWYTARYSTLYTQC